MALPNTAFNDIVATSLQGYSGEMTDNIINHNALLRQLDKKKNRYSATGRTIVQELEYAENSTVQWYVGAETLDISQSETFSAAEFSYKQLAANVVINGLEEIQNSGREAIHNLLRSRIRNMEKTLKNEVARALYATGTGNGGKEFGGLQLLVADVPTASVGGINSGTHEWWKNYVYDFSDAGVTASATTIQHAMNLAFINTTNGSDQVDLICSARDYFVFYLESLQVNQRFADDKGAGAGFTNLMFWGKTPVVFDDVAPDSHMYFLNCDYIFLRPAQGRWMKALGNKASINQDAIVVPMVSAGNMTVSNRSRQAVVTA